MSTSSDAPHTLRFVVLDEQEGQRLDMLLGERQEMGSRSQAGVLLKAGLVTVDGQRAAKSHRVQGGQVVEVTIPRPVIPPTHVQGLDVPILYEDAWLLVVDKPAGMVVHPAKGHLDDTMVNALSGHGLAGGDSYRPGVVHRLDRDTSGLLLVAKDTDVHRRLQQSIRSREVDRRYLALVHGNITAATGTIDAAIGRDPVRRKTMVVDGVGPREAVTHFEVMERFEDFTLIEARLETGRTHQIRVHLLAIGHPVAGDPVYARRDPLGVGRQFLHSFKIKFVHPVTGEPLEFQAPVPPDLTAILEALRGRQSRSA